MHNNPNTTTKQNGNDLPALIFKKEKIVSYVRTIRGKKRLRSLSVSLNNKLIVSRIKTRQSTALNT